MEAGVDQLNVLRSIAGEEAIRLNCSWLGPEHLLLAILSPAFDDSPASKALARCAVTREAVEAAIGAKQPRKRPERSGVTTNPACHDVVGFATGLASWRGTGAVTAEHVLIAQVYEAQSEGKMLTASRAAILSTLAELGVDVPEAPLPAPRRRVQRGERIYVSLDDLGALLAELPRLVPGGISWNRDDTRGWVQAPVDVDLTKVIPFALAAWNRGKLPCACCGYVTLSLNEPLGERLCPVCFWIDDPAQNNNPTYSAGRNAVSLNDGRTAFTRSGFARTAGRGKVRPPEADETPPALGANAG
jgi:hypothetical protein